MTLNEKRQQIIKFLGLENTDCRKIKIASLEGGKKDEFSHAESVKDILEEYGTLEYFEPTMKNGWLYFSKNGTYDNFKEFINECIANDVDIITCSKDCYIDRERLEYVKKAYENGIIFMIAAGNKDIEVKESDLGDLRQSPYVVTVSSYYLDSDNKMRWGGHNYGKVDLLMPTYIPTDLDDNGKLESSLHGTSFATPLGDVALAECMVLNSNINSKTVKDFIKYIGQDFRGYKYITLHNKAKIKSFMEGEKDMVETFKENKVLSEHFVSNEFKCPVCNVARIDLDLIDILEKLFTKMQADRIIITSGYRCNTYELSLPGGVFNGYHTQGKACDINVWKNRCERYTSKEICLALEDLGWNHGIGIISDTAVHIDTRENKYWFDERNGNKSIGASFYTYFNEKTNRDIVKERFGFDEDVTMKYLDNHPFAEALYEKLATK